MYTYQVVTTKVIAEGVARHEGATIEKVEFQDSGLGTLGGIGNEEAAIRTAIALYGPGVAASVLHYSFKITSKYPPNRKCWDCFGVVVWNLEETE